MLSKLMSQTRRNHALEHATIHILSEKHKGFSAQGNSTPYGYHLNIYGDISEDQVMDAVEEAHRRLRAGESQLGLHPNCGTVLLTTATLAVLATQATLAYEQRRQRRPKLGGSVWLGALPLAVLTTTLSLIISRPLGLAVQDALTVESRLGDLELAAIRQVPPSPVTRVFQFLLGQMGNQDVRSYRVDTRFAAD
ncbi:MAG: DUF6391 domain-containing protein [Candidatus Promineifilaceae bacterium]